VVDEQTVSGDPFDIAIDPSQFSNDSPKFLGIVTIDQVVAGGSVTNNDGTTRETGPQWQLGVKPVHFTIQGETGAYLTWFTPGTKKTSKMFAIIKAMSDLPEVFPKGAKVAKGQLVGIVCWWVRRDIMFGNALSRNVLIPVAPASTEEIAEAQEAVRGMGVAVNQSANYTDEDVETLLGILDGKTTDDAQLAAARNRNLQANLKQDILSGDAIKTLMGLGVIEMDTSGTITRVSTDEAVTDAA
jgi:hypothetical protein